MKLKSNSIAPMALLCAFAMTAQAAEPAAADKTTAPAASTPAPAAKKPEPKLSTTAQPRATTSPSAAPAQGTNATPRKSNDRLSLDTTIVTGNRELPKVLYIVPWKKADIGDLPAQPFNTLLDEVLTPVDRDVFRREVTYYGAITEGTEASRGAAAPPVSSSRSSEK